MVTGNNGENRTREKESFRGRSSYQSGKKEGNDTGNSRAFTRNDNSNGERRQNREDKPAYVRNGRPQKRNNSSGSRSGGGYYKEQTDENKRDNRSSSKSSQNRENRAKEQQPDKIEIINRIEKEKKAVKKKQAERKNSNRTNRQQSRPKRAGNIDWTKAYENDSYDDDDFDMYL